jgi:hypothetical protein
VFENNQNESGTMTEPGFDWFVGVIDVAETPPVATALKLLLSGAVHKIKPCHPGLYRSIERLLSIYVAPLFIKNITISEHSLSIAIFKGVPTSFRIKFFDAKFYRKITIHISQIYAFEELALLFISHTLHSISLLKFASVPSIEVVLLELCLCELPLISPRILLATIIFLKRASST